MVSGASTIWSLDMSNEYVIEVGDGLRLIRLQEQSRLDAFLALWEQNRAHIDSDAFANETKIDPKIKRKRIVQTNSRTRAPYGQYGVWFKSEPVGNIYCVHATKGGKKKRETDDVHLGYWIAENHCRRGFATQATTALKTVIHQEGVLLITAFVGKENEGSKTVLRRSGFKLSTRGIIDPKINGVRYTFTSFDF